MTNAVNIAQGGSNNVTFRNRIINGAMVIDQRNAGASVTNVAASGTYALDRWRYYGTSASKFTVQQNAGSVTPPNGYTNYLGITSLSANTPAATDEYIVQQFIEGYNIADLGWGAAGASSVTLSFWVRSSLTGTFGGVVKNSDNNRTYPFLYTVSAANTWEYKTITIPGDTSGTWLTTNGRGLTMIFNLGTGSTYLQTANAWTTSFANGATGNVNILGTNGATFYITGVQLEAGTTASPFEYRQFGTELALCQRYFEVGVNLIQAYGNSSNAVFGSSQFKVVKRALPTVTNQGLTYTGQVTLTDFTTNAGAPSYADAYSTYQNAMLTANYSGAPSTGMVRYQGYYTASAEL
jgi:hypothetical protein